VLNKIIYQIGLFFRNNKINKNLKFLLKSQYWSLEQLKAYQLRELSKLTHHAFENSAYYNNLFTDAGINVIPTITSKY